MMDESGKRCTDHAVISHSELLDRIRVELDHVHLCAINHQDTLGSLISTLNDNDIDIISLQQLDTMTQLLRSLSYLLDWLAHQQYSKRHRSNDISSLINLADMANRLLKADSEIECTHKQVGKFVLFE